MRARQLVLPLLFGLVSAGSASGGQAPRSAASPDIPITAGDRLYSADQYSNTVSVIDPKQNRLLGVVRLGDTQTSSLSPLYRGQLLVHGLGFSPDGRTLAVVAIGSNSVSFLDTATNAVKATTYLGRSPHEAFFTPDGRELWVTVRGENYIAVLDTKTYTEKSRIKVDNGPGMQIFSPDGKYGYVCSSFTAQTVVIRVSDHRVVGRIKQDSPFCPNIAVTPDGSQVWLTLKDIGKVMVLDAKPPFAVKKTLDTGPLTNHVNFVHTQAGSFAYVTVGALNSVKVFRTDTFEAAGVIPVGTLPHGLWPSGDGTRMYVGLENADAIAVIDTKSQRVVAEIPVGQAPQAVVYVPGAVREGEGIAGLQPLGQAAAKIQFSLRAPGAPSNAQPASSVSLFDQGLVQVLQAAIAGLEPRQPYILGLADKPDGSGRIELLASFKANPAGSAVVNTVGPIRQVVHAGQNERSRFVVVAPGTIEDHGAPVQVQSNEP